MSQDHDPMDETRQFPPLGPHNDGPYNIGPDTAGAPMPGYEDYRPDYGAEQGAQFAAPEPASAPSRGVKQPLARLGAPKLAALGAGLVIVVGGAVWGTTAALASSNSSSTTQAQGQDQNQPPADPGATTGGAGKKAQTGEKAAHVKITKVGAGSFTGTEGKGKTVIVTYGDDTEFGTKAHPLDPDQLQVGMTVTVAGTRQGGKITAQMIGVPEKKQASPGSSPSDGPSSIPSSSPASTISG